MGHKGIDQRPYDRKTFNENFEKIFGKKNEKSKAEKKHKPPRPTDRAR